MSYGDLLQRLKKEEEQEERRAKEPPAPPVRRAPQAPRHDGQTPTDIVLAALYDLPRRPRRRVA